MLSTVSAIASQSMGANLLQRAQKTLFYCIGITLSYGFVVAILFQCIAGGVVGLFTHDSLVIHLGTQYLRAYVLDCMAAGVHFCFSGFFAATGYSMVSFIHNITSIIVARIPGAYFASKLFPDTLFPMGLAAPIGGLVSIVICVIAYHMLVPKLLEQTKRENCA
jgi:Na+-driven multidrug efflux pump